MALVFTDSFDHYTTFLQKWSSGAGFMNTNPAFVRTGTQSLTENAPGFASVCRINFTLRDTMICGYAYYAASFGASGNEVSFWYNQGDQDEFARIDVLPNGQLNLVVNNGVVDSSAPGTLSTGAFFYIECKATFVSGGAYEVRPIALYVPDGRAGAI